MIQWKRKPVEAMGTPSLLRTDGTDGEGRPMADVLAVYFTRAQWTMARNQLRNMADVWGKDGFNQNMVERCNDLADAIDGVLFGG